MFVNPCSQRPNAEIVVSVGGIEDVPENIVSGFMVSPVSDEFRGLGRDVEIFLPPGFLLTEDEPGASVEFRDLSPCQFLDVGAAQTCQA